MFVPVLILFQLFLRWVLGERIFWVSNRAVVRIDRLIGAAKPPLVFLEFPCWGCPKLITRCLGPIRDFAGSGFIVINRYGQRIELTASGKATGTALGVATAVFVLWGCGVAADDVGVDPFAFAPCRKPKLFPNAEAEISAEWGTARAAHEGDIGTPLGKRWTFYTPA